MARHAKCLKGLKAARMTLKKVAKDALQKKYLIDIQDVIPQKLEDPGVLQFPTSLEIFALIVLLLMLGQLFT